MHPRRLTLRRWPESTCRWSAVCFRIRLQTGKSTYELVIRCPTKILRAARRHGEPVAESCAADTVDLHDAGVRPRLLQPQYGDVGNAECAGIPGAGAWVLHGRRPYSSSRLVGPRARPALVARRACGRLARGLRCHWAG